MALLEESHTEQDGPRSHLRDPHPKHILFSLLQAPTVEDFTSHIPGAPAGCVVYRR